MLKMSHDQSLTPYEQRLRDEVIYLHSLWHKPPPNPNSFTPSSTLHVFHPTSFKKTKRNKPTYQNAHRNTAFSESGSAPLQQMQYKVVQHCSEFLSKSFGEEDSFIDDKGVEESEEFKFLFGFFVEHRELRDLYENNQDSGDFYCLVCGHTQLFKGCFSLVQHALQMLNVNRKRAHRAFSLVICKLLGWDISKLPVIVLKGEPLRQSLANLGKTLNYLNDDGKKVSGMEGGVTDYENSLDDNDAKVHVDGLEKENFRTDESGVVNHETSATEGGTEANNIADDLGNDGLNQK